MGNSKTKWKDAFLKTGLPLEHLVAEQFSNQRFWINGEYSFIRKNEQNIASEFSVDLHVSKLLHKTGIGYWANLDFLIECKYSYQTVKWIFAPHSKESLISGEVLTVFDDLCTRKIEKRSSLHNLNNSFYYCVKGIELHADGANPQSITRGLYQLKYAVPQLAKSIHQLQLFTLNDEDLHIGFVCPILVTTASLHVINQDLTLKEIEDSENLEEITERVDALVVSQENTPQLASYISEITCEISKYADTINRLEALAQIRGQLLSEYLPKTFYLDHKIRSSSQSILVIQYDSLQKYVKKIQNAVRNCGKYLTQYAKMEKVPGKQQVQIHPFH
jgi:hypothetical protein